VLYLIYALFAGLVGTAFSVLIRLELSGPGVQFIADYQLYNSIITAHAIIMIFFMVEKYFILKSQSFTLFNRVNSDNNNSSLSASNNDKHDNYKEYYNNENNNSNSNEGNNSNNNESNNSNSNEGNNSNNNESNNSNSNEGNNSNNNESNNSNSKKHNYVKVLVDDPFNNRDIILKVTKKQKGVYI
jgi:cytochrome c oxidase subunit 1